MHSICTSLNAKLIKYRCTLTLERKVCNALLHEAVVAIRMQLQYQSYSNNEVMHSMHSGLVSLGVCLTLSRLFLAFNNDHTAAERACRDGRLAQ